MINVNTILKICHGSYLGTNYDIPCLHFSSDTRTINKGDIYVGIKGDTFNGNNFYQDALSKGATLCILDDDTKIDSSYQHANIILVSNTIEAIQKIASYKREQYDIPVIAVTGSVGKTSVKDMIYAVLSKKYNVHYNRGNKNNHIGLPFTILELDKHDAMIVEMGMNHFGEIHTLTNIAKPTIGVITNIGTAHIGNLGSRENILKAKLEILDGMPNGTLIINNDNDLLHTVKYDKLITTGIHNHSDYMAKDISIDAFSSTFSINDNYLTLPIGSEAFINNALLAYAVGIKLGVPIQDIEDALENLKLTPHRLEVIKHQNYTLIDDTYNASLDSVKNAAELLNRINDHRRVFIFADILELDAYGEDIHTQIGQIMFNNNIDLLITVGNLSKYTHEIFKSQNNNCYHFDNNQQLLTEIKSLINQDDFILIKGSHSMNLIEIVNYLKNN